MGEMYVIYDHPKDFPKGFVTRVHEFGPGWHRPTERVWYAASLEAARAAVPAHMVRLERDPNDEPQIAEMWV